MDFLPTPIYSQNMHPNISIPSHHTQLHRPSPSKHHGQIQTSTHKTCMVFSLFARRYQSFDSLFQPQSLSFDLLYSTPWTKNLFYQHCFIVVYAHKVVVVSSATTIIQKLRVHSINFIIIGKREPESISSACLERVGYIIYTTTKQ